jgi:hypothetical protein
MAPVAPNDVTGRGPVFREVELQQIARIRCALGRPDRMRDPRRGRLRLHRRALERALQR